MLLRLSLAYFLGGCLFAAYIFIRNKPWKMALQQPRTSLPGFFLVVALSYPYWIIRRYQERHMRRIRAQQMRRKVEYLLSDPSPNPTFITDKADC